MFKFEKYQSAIFVRSSSDSAATLERELGKTFCWVCMVFFFFFLLKQDKFYQNFSKFNKKFFSIFKQKLIIQYNHIKYSTSS